MASHPDGADDDDKSPGRQAPAPRLDCSGRLALDWRVIVLSEQMLVGWLKPERFYSSVDAY